MKSRRQFIASAAGAALAVPFAQAWSETPSSATGPFASLEAGDPLFRFLQINDTHYQSVKAKVTHPTYNQANGRVHWVIEAIKSGTVFPDVDFVLHLGDMTHQHSVDRRHELQHFKALLDTLPMPVYPVVGNHDTVQGEGHPEKEAPYREVFGDRADYAFSHKGVGFVIVDVSGTGEPDLPPERVRQRDQLLKKHLEAYADRPVILATHVPLVPMRELPVLMESFGFASFVVREPGVLELVRTHRSHVAAVLSGHLHLSGVVHDQGVAHVDVAGTASYPHDVALHTVYRDRLETRFVRLPSDLLVPSTNIHGAHRFGRDFTDVNHPDYTSYLMGGPDERTFSVPLHPVLS